MSDKQLLIKGGTVVDPSQKLDAKRDILIRDGIVASIDKTIPTRGTEVFDAAGMLVMPGLIDMHTHLREPGFEDAETIASGCAAAAAGGFTAVCPMPNTNPPTDDAGCVRYIQKLAAAVPVRVYPVGAITRERKGELIVEMARMAEAGAVAFSDDGVSVYDALVMFNALRYAAMVGKPIILHEEEPSLARNGQMNDGALSTELGLRGIPSITEEIMVARDISLAEYTRTPIHVTHISTKGTVALIRAAKARGVKVTCDVTPHHLTLTEELVASYDTRYKMNPPLRRKEDVEALREALRDGTIDAIATDHAPHSLEFKEREFIYAPFGVTGLETALAVMHRELVATGVLGWTDVVTKLSAAPAAILGVPGGNLAEGTPADITVYDPGACWKVEPEKMKSRSVNTPYIGWELPGRTAAVVVDGILHRQD